MCLSFLVENDKSVFCLEKELKIPQQQEKKALQKRKTWSIFESTKIINWLEIKTKQQNHQKQQNHPGLDKWCKKQTTLSRVLKDEDMSLNVQSTTNVLLHYHAVSHYVSVSSACYDFTKRINFFALVCFSTENSANQNFLGMHHCDLVSCALSVGA